MCDARTETERLLAEQRDRALSDRDRAEGHLLAAQKRIMKLEDAICRHRRAWVLGEPLTGETAQRLRRELWSVLDEDTT